MQSTVVEPTPIAPAPELTRDQRLHLRSLAHALKPVVLMGQHGLTDAVLREISLHLDAHELIKVRRQGGDRPQREADFEAICTALSCAAVQHIGKTLVLYRPAPSPKLSLSPDAATTVGADKVPRTPRTTKPVGAKPAGAKPRNAEGASPKASKLRRRSTAPNQ